MANLVKAIQHAVQVAGAAHVALGSDFDGATRTPFDTRGMAVITDGLLEAGMDQDTIARVMGGNTRDFLLQQLPWSLPPASRSTGTSGRPFRRPPANGLALLTATRH